MPEPEKRKALCMYCGHAVHYTPNDEMDQARAWKALLDHDGVCQKNPLVVRVAELESALGNLTSWAENTGWFSTDDPVFRATVREAQGALKPKPTAKSTHIEGHAGFPCPECR